MSNTKPTDPAALAEELERLHEGATEAPWCWDNRGEKCNDIHVGTACTEPDGNPIAGYFDEENVTYLEDVGPVTNAADAKLITTLRNALPAICQHLRSLAELREQREGEKESAAREVASIIRKAVQYEREACAVVAEDCARGKGWEEYDRACFRVADRIRSRASTATPAPGKEGG